MLCTQCGREFVGADDLCNTCQVRNFLQGFTPAGAKNNIPVTAPKMPTTKAPVTNIQGSRLPDGTIVRMCMDCRSVYLAKGGKSLEFVTSCKYCGKITGFFETAPHFRKYVRLYGSDKLNIRDPEVNKILE